jgi:hypothetical protein
MEIWWLRGRGGKTLFEMQGRFCTNVLWIPREAVNGAAELRVV